MGKDALRSITFWSVVLILVGVLLLAKNLGLLSPALVRFWPVGLVILGLVGLSGDLSKR